MGGMAWAFGRRTDAGDGGSGGNGGGGGWARRAMEGLLDRHSYWLHARHATASAHAMANYEASLYGRARLTDAAKEATCAAAALSQAAAEAAAAAEEATKAKAKAAAEAEAEAEAAAAGLIATAAAANCPSSCPGIATLHR